MSKTQPDTKRRAKEMQFPPVKEAALSHGIPVFQPIKVREAGLWKNWQDKADVIVVVAFGQILPKAIGTDTMDVSMYMRLCFRNIEERHRSSGRSLTEKM